MKTTPTAASKMGMILVVMKATMPSVLRSWAVGRGVGGCRLGGPGVDLGDSVG